MKILISAAETSSDAHAAELLRALRSELRKSPGSDSEVQAYGIGGPKLAAEGLRQIVDARELLSMGFTEILGRLPKILSALGKIEREARANPPDVAVFLDYPDFHFKLAKRLSKLGIPLVYYIPPKVWAWRKGRVRFLRRFFRKILCILPFEEEFYRRAAVPVRYVGNPLQDELPLRATRDEARKKLGLASSDRVLAVLPGSRPTELKRHLRVFLGGAENLAGRLERRGLLRPDQKLQILLPFAATSSLEQMRARVSAEATPSKTELHVSQGDSAWAMLAADAGLIKSGTSTLEAALLGLPNVIAYRPNALTCFIVWHLIRYRRPIGLSNLVIEPVSKLPRESARAFSARSRPIPEFICSAVTADALGAELEELFWDSEKSCCVQSALKAVRASVLRGQDSPSLVAAREILMVSKGASPRREPQ